MYEQHFGLKRRPFRPTLDCDSYYPATTHEQALERLVQALRQEEGFLLLTGVTGMGKTLLCHRFLEQLGPDTVSAFLTHGRFTDRLGLLQSLAYELSIPFVERTEQQLRLALTDFMLENYKAGSRTILLVDEAQHLSVDLLEEMRLWGNLEAPQGRAVHVVLIGLPAIRDTLQQDCLAPLRQRLAVQAVLEPFGPEEAADYLVYQLRQAGGRPEAIIADEALALLARASQGVPRLLNHSAHQALLLAAAADQSQVDAEAALEALALLGIPSESASDDRVSLAHSLDGPADGDEEATEDQSPSLQMFKAVDPARQRSAPGHRASA